MREFDSEPVPGLPEHLPEGERILWQGRPEWVALARRAFHVSGVAIYFVVLAVVLAWHELSASGTTRDAVQAAAGVVPGALVALALLAALAALTTRSALYTITTRRVVMRFGIALPIVLNIPFKQIKSADLRVYSDGTGDIPLVVSAPKRQSMVVLWPHVRPWRARDPQPMLRCIPDASRVAEILAAALRVEFPDAFAVPVRVETPAPGGAPVAHGQAAA
ncbi:MULTISPECIES: photosynthetic complex putative assembly protein PuhB [Hyphomicrobium]|uniref:photosynthetic complex putative assembly protein PuhB n=1 Tax=Hyphomicrobium TaxID=81 RepID=UPI000378AB39|nr:MULTISPECIES: photosynthetic complex putative assembly protein PuhB [Hyphomicrobium]WBT37004.1 photosynthetic complex putative assembly protein PuhB [Hyphomicrobium sp. DMF-1]HML41550.1 photosynthetic complex putative assembly protein PuhB [Hyphomicrobium zavarzinii]